MNGRKAKQVRRMANQAACQWLKNMLPEDQKELVTPASLKEFEGGQEQHIYANGKILCSAYSSRWFLKRIKKAMKRGENPNFILKSVEELG